MARGVLVRGRGGGAAGGGATCAMASRIPVMRVGRVRVPAASSFRLSAAPCTFFRFDVLGSSLAIPSPTSSRVALSQSF